MFAYPRKLNFMFRLIIQEQNNRVPIQLLIIFFRLQHLDMLKSDFYIAGWGLHTFSDPYRSKLDVPLQTT